MARQCNAAGILNPVSIDYAIPAQQKTVTYRSAIMVAAT
jgi:hypothetical protein